MVPEDKLPGEMCGRDVKRIKFEINKTHLEEETSSRARKDRVELMLPAATSGDGSKG